MQTQTAPPVSKDGIVLYIFLLTTFFFLVEISFFIQCNKAYLTDFKFVSYKLHIPFSIIIDVIYFIFAQLFLHFIYGFFICLTSTCIASYFSIKSPHRLKLAIFTWFLGIVAVLVANEFFFPNSKFAILTSLISISPIQTKICVYFFGIIWVGISVITLLALLAEMLEKIYFYFLLLLTCAFLSIIYFKPSPSHLSDAATADKPNIIFIGFDSLRPDFLGYFGASQATPFFDKLLNTATVFNEAVTPLARTFPSWTSILTGQYPRETGIRYNLSSHDQIKFNDALPAILRSEGYTTIYATDETRFSNMDKNFGFDAIISPPVGLADFLIGTFNDFPISNLIVNSLPGKWLFPYSYANRPVYHTYKPNTFLELIESNLPLNRDKPIFLAAHFCLTHHPYLWATLSSSHYNVWERYAASVERVDQQLHDFFDLLKKNNLLTHAIVVFLSDHGEALEFQGDRITEKESYVSSSDHLKDIPKFYPPSLDEEGVNQSAGHGTDVLGLTQYHTLLAFKTYGLKFNQQSGIFSGIVSLLDVKPTILTLLNFHQGNRKKILGSGTSLANIIQGEANQVYQGQHIFLESDFSPAAIRTVYPETRKVLLEGVHLFRIDPLTSHLTVKESMGRMIIKSKQYADIFGEWMLALYPQDKAARMPILINLVTGQWTNDLSSSFAQNSPALPMLSALQQFYGDELA